MLLFLLACADPAPPSSANVVHDGSTVADHLARQAARLDRLEAAEPSAAELSAERLAALDERLSRMETIVTQLQVANGSGMPAAGAVAPSLNTPGAVATFEERLAKLEEKANGGQPMGDPGSGLFEVPKGGGKGKQAPPPGGKGGQPGGPPPQGGQPQGGQPQGGQPQGGAKQGGQLQGGGR